MYKECADRNPISPQTNSEQARALPNALSLPHLEFSSDKLITQRCLSPRLPVPFLLADNTLLCRLRA